MTRAYSCTKDRRNLRMVRRIQPGGRSRVVAKAAHGSCGAPGGRSDGKGSAAFLGSVGFGSSVGVFASSGRGVFAVSRTRRPRRNQRPVLAPSGGVAVMTAFEVSPFAAFAVS